MDYSSFAGTGKNRQGSGGAAAATGAATGGAKRTHPLRPVTIKMLNDSQHVGDGVLVLDGRELGQAIVVGRVVEHEAPGSAATAKFHGYKVSDGSGIITVRHWLDPSSLDQPQIPLGETLRAVGTVKIFQDKPMITGTVRGISSNELYYHFLDTVLTHLRLTQGPRDSAANSPSAARVTPAASPALGMKASGGHSIEDAIKRVIQGANQRDGLTIDAISNALTPLGYQIGETRQAVKHLTSQGVLYTVDEIHFGY
jgi:replication factor A2